MGFQNLIAVCAMYAWTMESHSVSKIEITSAEADNKLRPLSLWSPAAIVIHGKFPAWESQQLWSRGTLPWVETRKGRSSTKASFLTLLTNRFLLTHSFPWTQVSKWAGREEGEGMSDRNTSSSWIYFRNARLVQQLDIYHCDRYKAEKSYYQ